MPLRKIIVYGPGDVSADYTQRGGGNGDVWITFFVYPMGHPFADEDADIQKSLIEKWSATRIPPLGAAPNAASDGTSGWFHGTFQGMQATNSYILVRRDGWFLEARCTIPDVAGSTGIDRAVNALNAIPWSWRPAVSAVTAQFFPAAIRN